MELVPSHDLSEGFPNSRPANLYQLDNIHRQGHSFLYQTDPEDLCFCRQVYLAACLCPCKGRYKEHTCKAISESRAGPCGRVGKMSDGRSKHNEWVRLSFATCTYQVIVKSIQPHGAIAKFKDIRRYEAPLASRQKLSRQESLVHTYSVAKLHSPTTTGPNSFSMFAIAPFIAHASL